MVNSGPLGSEGDRNTKASCTAVTTQSSSPITAAGAVQCKKDCDGDSVLPSEIRAIEPTPAKIQTNGEVIKTLPLLPSPSPSSSTGGLCCSLPLVKVQNVLCSYQQSRQKLSESTQCDQMAKKPRKLFCLYCERTFVSVNLRTKHIDRCHSAKNNRRVSSRRNAQNVTVTPCFHCDKLSTSEHTLKDLFRHLTIEHATKYFGCLQCEDRFLNTSQLNDHNCQYHGQYQAPRLENEVRNKLRPRSDDATAKHKGKRMLQKGAKLALKRSKRLQAQSNQKVTDTTSNRKKTIGKAKKEVKRLEEAVRQSPPPGINPYPEFDSFFQVKKITDHSIDNLKISSLTFDDVFDKAFFNRIRCNIQENLQHHIDGKLFENEESESRISNFEKICHFGEELQQVAESYGCEVSLNAATPATSLLSTIQFGEDPESQIEYGSKPSKKKLQQPIHYKYFTRRKYQASILEHKENRDMSKLDMSTQYAVKKRQQTIAQSKKTPEEMAEFLAGSEYQSQLKREELNRVLDRRCPFEDLREEATKKAALERNEPEKAEHEREIRAIVGDLVEKAIEIIETSPPTIDRFSLGEIPDYLDLRPKAAASCSSDGEIDRSDKIALICSSQETEYVELPTNSVRGKHEKVELTGEWARARIYVCGACGLKLDNIKQLLEHKSVYHQHVWVQHYEFVGNQSELYRHLCIPNLGKVGELEDSAHSGKSWRRSDARSCTKCGKQCNALGELHRHILECGGDWTWMLARKKCKYRPFGTKSRRKRRGLVKRFTNQKVEPTEKKIYKKTFEGPRPRPSDAETIERMLANLPPKRATRKIMSLKDGFHNVRRASPTKTSKDTSVDGTSTIGVQSKKNGYRKNVRSLNKVLASRILDTNASLLVKRKLKSLSNANRVTTRQTNQTETASSLDCDRNKMADVAPTTAKRTSPRIKIPLTVPAAGKSADIKWFFPVRKATKSSQPSAGKRKANVDDDDDDGTSKVAKPSDLTMKSSPPILTREEETAPFLGQIGASNDDDDQPPRLEKIVIATAITEDESVASVPPPLPVAVSNNSMVEVEGGIEVGCDHKWANKKARKPTRGLNDCIAMLTNKLNCNDNVDVDKTGNDLNIFKLMPSPRQLETNEPPKIRGCILKVPSVVFTINHSRFEAIAAPPPESISPIDVNVMTDLDESLTLVEGGDDDVETSPLVVAKIESEDELPLASLLRDASIALRSLDGECDDANVTDEVKAFESSDSEMSLEQCDNLSNFVQDVTTKTEMICDIEEREPSVATVTFESGEIKENCCTEEGRKRSIRNGNANVLDEALTELTESERNRELSLNDSQATRKDKNKRTSPIGTKSVNENNSNDAMYEFKEECSSLDGMLRRSRRSSRKITSYNESDPIFDQIVDDPPVKVALSNDDVRTEPNCRNLFDDFKDDQFEVFEHVLEEVDGCEAAMKIANHHDDGDVSETVIRTKSPSKRASELSTEETIQKMIEAERIGVGMKPKLKKSRKRQKKGKKDPGETSRTLDNSPNLDVCEDVTMDTSAYCDICQKTFRRADTLNKHKRTLTHISKLSEMEAHEAELKKINEINDINLFDMLQNIDNRTCNDDNDDDAPPSSPFSMAADNPGLKLADIINDVLNKPVMNAVSADESSVELKSEFGGSGGRLKSLGERKSFDQEYAGTILEKQINLLQNMIENKMATLDAVDDLSSLSSSEMKMEDTKLVENDSCFFKPPSCNHYEDISDDCDDPKSRKILNRDEELFLECCSLLKSGSEVSNSKKRLRTSLEREEEGEERDWLFNDSNESDSNCADAKPLVDNKKVLTKGAMKVFEGLKVSIPTVELNMSQVLNVTSQKRQINRKNDRKRFRKIIDDVRTLPKSGDVYDFEETQDNSDVFAKPSDFKSFRNQLPTNECESPPTTTTTKKKCLIMGRIFKNAAKPRTDDVIRDIPTVENAKLVEDFVLNCSEAVKLPPSVMTEEEMNAAFDRLVEGGEEIKRPLPPPPPLQQSSRKSKKSSSKLRSKKRNRVDSDSTDDEFDLNAMKKRKNPKDNCINLEQELKECIGVASRKSQRKCTSGKQNVLVEYWSSDESLFEALLESQVLEASNGANRVKSPESAAVPPISPDDTTLSNRKNRGGSVETTPNDSSSSSSRRRKRTAPNPLYHWSSSSEDESSDLIRVKPIREELDDDEDRPIHHGWIVGDSPKKLVTMLAQAKGKKCDVDGVKEQGKRRH